MLTASLHAAVQAALATQEVASVDALTCDKTRDDIVSVPAGVVGARAMDWQNRPTFQQVVQFTGHRRSAAAPAATARRGSLPATGLPAALPLAGLGLLGAVLLVRSRRART